MPTVSGLGAGLISRRVRRLFDQRGEPRAEADGIIAEVTWRGSASALPVANLSSSGAMVDWTETLRIGEPVGFRLPDGRAAFGNICWVRDGRVGLYFATTLE